jgi:hypothetical protein
MKPLCVSVAQTTQDTIIAATCFEEPNRNNVLRFEIISSVWSAIGKPYLL